MRSPGSPSRAYPRPRLVPARRLGPRAPLCAALLATLSWGTDAAAQSLVSATEPTPVQQRIALAVGPTRTTLWTDLEFDAVPGDVGLVVPLAAGAAVDQATRAFFEALDEATAPRVLAPENGPQGCPGEPPLDPVVEAGLGPASTLAPLELLVLDDLPAVEGWAAGRGFVVPASVSAALGLQSATRFLVARFASAGATARTPTFRVSTPAGVARFPLVLSRATDEDLRVVLFAVGEGRADLGDVAVPLGATPLRLEFEPPSSNYQALLAEALGPPGSYVVESASHTALRSATPAGTGEIPSVVASYFARAAAYGDATGEPGTCASNAAVVLGQSAVVGSTCPRGDLAVVPGGALCSDDAVEPGEVAPDLLRCGGIADDVALALSDLEPDAAWITRAVQRVPAGATGADRAPDFAGGASVSPVLVASAVDLAGCGGEGGAGGAGPSGSGPSGSGPGATTGVGSGAGEPVYVEVPLRSYEGCGCSGTWVTIDYLLVDAGEEPPPDAYYVEDDGGCSGDSTDGYESESYTEDPSTESCTSDTTGSYETESGGSDESLSGDDCAGDSSGDSGGDCGGDTSSDSGGDDCGGDTSSEGGDDCAVSTRRGRGPGRVRLSVLSFFALALALPLRRRARRRASATLR